MFEDDDEGDDYAENYSESDDMKSESEFNKGIHMEADSGCKPADDYGGRKQGGAGRGDYNEYGWRGWDNEDDEDTF